MHCILYRSLTPVVFFNHAASAIFYSVLCVVLSLLVFTDKAAADTREVAVYDGQSLHTALRNANPGDDIVLYPGDYSGIKTESPENRWHYFHSHRSGTSNAPMFDNIAIHNVRDEGLHFRQSSSNNTLRNCHIFDTGRLKPGFGEAVYVGTHEGDRLADHSNNNRIGGCLFGPGVTAEAIDIKAGTVNTIVEHNTMNGADISGVNYADSFIDIKGDEIIIRFNQMNWQGNSRMDHGIHVLRREHNNSNVYNNEVTLANGSAFLKIGRGTVKAANNQLLYSGKLASTYSSGEIDSRLDNNLPPVQNYTGFQDSSEPPETEPEPEPEPTECLSIERDRKVELNLGQYSCVDFPIELQEHLLQVWDSNANPSCNFRGNVISSSGGPEWTVSANYAGTRNMRGSRIHIQTTNRCEYLIVRWL